MLETMDESDRKDGSNGRGLDNSLEIEHVCEPDRAAMLAALRVLLGLPKRLPGTEMDRR